MNDVNMRTGTGERENLEFLTSPSCQRTSVTLAETRGAASRSAAEAQ